VVAEPDLLIGHHVDPMEALPDQARQAYHRCGTALPRRDRSVSGLDATRVGGDLRRRKMGGQWVTALRDIYMPTNNAQRGVDAPISVEAADLHCSSSEYVLSKDTTGDTD
jgi:hypothetical protein